MWPTMAVDPVSSCRIIPTAYASLVFDTSLLHSKSSPINCVHISLNIRDAREQCHQLRILPLPDDSTFN